MRLKSVALGFLTLVGLSATALQAADFDREFEEPAWVESGHALPAFPEKENLIPFRVGSVADTQFFIDGSTISVGADEVIRYVLVVIGSEGAWNVSFEGMRCLTAERRAYAFGRKDKSWIKAKSDRWIAIRGGSNHYHAALFNDYFCAIGATSIMKPEDARRALRYGAKTE